jgi:hypothetical protein
MRGGGATIFWSLPNSESAAVENAKLGSRDEVAMTVG